MIFKVPTFIVRVKNEEKANKTEITQRGRNLPVCHYYGFLFLDDNNDK